MRALPDLHLHIHLRALADDGVDGQVAVEPVFDSDSDAALRKNLLRFGRFDSNNIRHRHFAALDGKAHRRQRAKERYRGQYEYQQRHAENPVQALAQVHRVIPVSQRQTSFAHPSP